MRTYAFLALLLPALAAGRLFEDGAYLGDIEGIERTWIRTVTSPASVPTSGSAAAASTSVSESLELRQAPELAPVVTVPAVDPALAPHPAPANPVVHAANPEMPAPANPAVPAPIAPQDPGIAPVNDPVPPAAPAPNMPDAIAPVVNPIAPAAPLGAVPVVITTTSTTSAVDEFVTTQWIETWIDSTYSTWVPKTVTFKPHMTQAPLPGKGEIGMGTLTGKTGQTSTIMMGAAPSQAVGWMRGLAAAVGVGIAGAVV